MCNAEIDSIMYDLPPVHTMICGHSKKYGEHLSLNFSVLNIQKQNTGKQRTPSAHTLMGEYVVYAIIIIPKSKNSSRSLFFFSKNSKNIILDYSNWGDKLICEYKEKNIKYFSYSCHSPLWNIEVFYSKSKIF